MKILIFGAGAMGSVFGGFLSNKNEVTLIGRESHISTIEKKGLFVSGIWGDHQFSKLKGYNSVKKIPMGSTFDLIMIMTKSYDTLEAVREVQSFVEKGSAVISMQNGIGNEDVISSEVGIENTMGGMAIFGARLIEPGHVEVTVYASEVLVGDLIDVSASRAVKIARIFSKSGIPTRPSDNIIRDKWMKAFYNIALNPLSAILRVPYGELGKSEETQKIIKDLLREGFEVANALHILLKLEWKEYFSHLIEKQLPPTAEHISSMLQDIKRGKMTEIDYLNGAIVKLGEDLGIKTPVNETITRIIKALEKKSQ
jgi:2-dehydropantoate 2-reductase